MNQVTRNAPGDAPEGLSPATVEEIAVFVEPARKIGIHDLKPATFLPLSRTAIFIAGSSVPGGSTEHIIKVFTEPRQAGRELLAISILGEGAEGCFILRGTALYPEVAGVERLDPKRTLLMGLVMPYYPYSLDMFIDRFTPLETSVREEVALLMILRLSRAVRYAHRKGLLHCDIKPENILANDYEERLADWDRCRLLTDVTVREDLFRGFGSPRYHVVLESDWSVVMIDRVGLVMVFLELLGLLEPVDVLVPTMQLKTVTEAAAKTENEFLRDAMRRFCRVKRNRPPPPEQVRIDASAGKDSGGERGALH